METVGPADELCVSCAHPVTTPYCANCGERRASDRAFSLREFGADILEAFLSFDGRALRTAKLLLRRPGELTLAYMRGSRLPYLAPLQAFLVFNVLYFAASTVLNDHTFSTPLVVHMKYMPYSESATRAVTAKLAKTGQDLASFSHTFNTVGNAQSKSLVLAMVPVFALCVGLVTIDRKRYAVQHLAFALHVFAFFFFMLPFAIVFVVTPLVFLLKRIQATGGALGFDSEISMVIAFGLAIYIERAMRRAYGLGRVRSTITSVFLVGGFYLSLQLYRAILFWVTLWSV